MDYSNYPNYVPFSKMTLKDNFPEWIVVHCSASDYDNAASIQRYHITDPGHLWENTGYHWIIERGGKLVAGRPENYHGAHVAEKDLDGVKINKKSVGICICGNMDKHLPDDAQVATLKKLLADLMDKYKIKKERIMPHRYWTKTKTCYGSQLSDFWASDLIAAPMPVPAPVPPVDVEKEKIKKEITELSNKIISLTSKL